MHYVTLRFHSPVSARLSCALACIANLAICVRRGLTVRPRDSKSLQVLFIEGSGALTDSTNNTWTEIRSSQSYPVNVSNVSRQVDSVAASTPPLTGLEVEVVNTFEPENHSIEHLALSIGDRIKITYDPQAELDEPLRSGQEHHVFGVKQSDWRSGWFSMSHTRPVGGTSMSQSNVSGWACRNSFFSDWGSSGMKLFRVHSGGAGSTVGEGEEEKLEALTGDVTADLFEKELTSKCWQLKNKGNVDPNTWRIYATAGLRLHVNNADKLWQRLRKNMSKVEPCGPLLAECSATSHKGCRTLSGATEALYEMSAYFKQGYPISDKQGWISAGGASLQIGFFGLPHSAMRTCLAKMNAVWADDNIMGSPTYDSLPGMVAYQGSIYAPSLGDMGAVSGRLPNGRLVFLFSFLAVQGFHGRLCR